MRPLCRSTPIRSGRDARSAGHDAEHGRRGKSREDREDEHCRIEAARLRRAGRFAGPICSSSFTPASASSKAKQRTAHRQHECFREHLPDEPCAAAAERRAHREFALAARRAHENEIRDVRARNQQHEHDRAHQREHDRPHIRDEIFVHRLRAEIDARGLLDRETLPEIGAERVELRLRGGRRSRPGVEPADHGGK